MKWYELLLMAFVRDKVAPFCNSETFDDPAPLTRTVRSQRVVCIRLRASRARTRPNDLLAHDLLQGNYMLAPHCMKRSIRFSPGVLQGGAQRVMNIPRSHFSPAAAVN